MALLPALVVVVSVAFLSYLVYRATPSADLLASWIAGHFLEIGALDRIYPQDTTAFTMLPPPGWQAYLDSHEYGDTVFPFIYPPLWAVVFGWLTRITEFTRVAQVASLVNPLLMGGMVLLAWRAGAARMSALHFTVIGLLVLFGSSIGTIAIFQNQPQILVAFLMVLAVERSQAGAPLTAGAALALAASIKLYPAAFALLWLASGDRRAFGAFLVVGLGLGALSVALAGWPLHRTFLNQFAVIGRTVMVTGFSFSLDPSIAQVFFADRLQFIADPAAAAAAAETGVPADRLGWSVMTKPPLWAAASLMLMGAVLLFAMRRMHRAAPGGRALLWPMTFALFALLSPLSWGYHYLPAAAFAPMLIEGLGGRRGWPLLALVFLPLALPFFAFYRTLDFVGTPSQIVGTAAMALYALALAHVALGRAREKAPA